MTKLNPKVPAFGPLPVGVIGCGKMGRFHAKVYGKMPQVKLVGVCDQSPDAAAAAADEAGTQAFTSIDDLLAEAAAVTVAVPTVAHPDVAERCMAAGVACLIEKPLAKDVADARRLCAAANLHQRINHACTAPAGIRRSPAPSWPGLKTASRCTAPPARA